MTSATARVSVDDAGFKEKIAGDEAALDGLGMGFSKIGAAVGVAAMTLPALPGVLAAGAGAAGVAALAFGGVAKALQDSTKASTAATSTQGKNSASGRYRAVERRGDRGRAAGYLGCADSGGARRGDVSGERRAGRGIPQGRRAGRAAGAAAKLTQARQDAIRTLQQLNNTAADSKLAAQQAQLDLEQATQNQIAVDKTATSTALQKKQAALSVAEAQQRLKEAQQQATNATQDANKANKEGVDGLPSVVSAQQQVANATRGDPTLSSG